VIGPIEQA
jgi:hypothetical protein